MKVLIVGGGVTGLAAAWEAMQAGHEVTVCESSDRFGGKVWTERTGGWTIEHGPDSFVAYRPAALTLAEELGIGDQVSSVAGGRTVYLRARGRLRPLPQGMGMVLPTKLWPFATTAILSPAAKLRAGLDLFLPRQLPAGDIAIGTFLRRRLGAGIVNGFADPMVGGIYGAGVDELSLDAVLPSLRVNEQEHRSLILAGLATGRSQRRRSGSAPGSPFRSFRLGLGQFVDALADALRAGGVALHSSTAVGKLADHDADAVILAGGVTPSAELLRDHVPEAAAALSGVPLTSSTVVTLGFPASAVAEPVTHQGWLEAGAAPVSGVTVSSAKWPSSAPSGSLLVRAFVPARLGAIATAGDTELVERIVQHISPDLGITGAPELVRVARWNSVMPAYTVGHLDRVAAVSAALAGRRWRVAGSALHGVGIPDCIADGRAQAQAVLA